MADLGLEKVCGRTQFVPVMVCPRSEMEARRQGWPNAAAITEDEAQGQKVTSSQ